MQNSAVTNGIFSILSITYRGDESCQKKFGCAKLPLIIASANPVKYCLNFKITYFFLLKAYENRQFFGTYAVLHPAHPAPLSSPAPDIMFTSVSPREVPEYASKIVLVVS